MIRVIDGDCVEVLKTLDAGSIHTCVTSPPYWGLRDYGVVGQMGSEGSPELYCNRMVEVFREVRRVLRDDATAWINLGDSFSSKQLCGIPWRVAFALQADGWYLRSEIIWSKPNPMPESVTDRPTKAHEYIFLLTKRERYFYDAAAIAEDVTGNAHARGSGVNPKCVAPGLGIKQNSSFSAACNELVTSRNKRSVWTVTTKPFSQAHFATFPPDLIEPCILAGCPAQCCAQCGAPWERVTEKGEPVQQHWAPGTQVKADIAQGKHGATSVLNTGFTTPRITTGVVPTCACNAGTVPGTVLDPFGGAGTTGLVADRHQRNAILIELNPEYAAMARERITGDAPLFAEVA